MSAAVENLWCAIVTVRYCVQPTRHSRTRSFDREYIGEVSYLKALKCSQLMNHGSQKGGRFSTEVFFENFQQSIPISISAINLLNLKELNGERPELLGLSRWSHGASPL